MCSACAEGGTAANCPECRERGAFAFPFTRDNYSLDGLLNHALDRFKQHWTVLVGATAIVFVGSYAVSMMASIFVPLLETTGSGDELGVAFVVFMVVSQVLQLLAQTWAQLAMIAVSLDALRGGEPQLASLLSCARRIPVALLLMLIAIVTFAVYGGAVAGAGVLVPDEFVDLKLWIWGGGALLGIVPMAYFWIGLFYAQTVLIDDPSAGPIAALRRSFRIASGKRLSILGTLIVGSLIMGAGALACCVGMLASYPLGMMLWTGLYLALSNKGEASAALR